jgi:hypothetical protein
MDMTNTLVHQVEIVAPSIDALKEVLDVSGELSEGIETALAEGATLTVSDLSKSSGFDATTIILTGFVSIAVSTTSAVLTEWLKAKLLKKKDDTAAHKGITIFIDGKKIEISEGG